MSKPKYNTNVKVRFRGRDYFVNQDRWPNGTAALHLVNPGSGQKYPATVEVGLLPQKTDHVFVPEFSGMLDALEKAGIVKPTSVVGRMDFVNIRTCELIHPALLLAHQEGLGAERPEIVRESKALADIPVTYDSAKWLLSRTTYNGDWPVLSMKRAEGLGMMIVAFGEYREFSGNEMSVYVPEVLDAMRKVGAVELTGKTETVMGNSVPVIRMVARELRAENQPLPEKMNFMGLER